MIEETTTMIMESTMLRLVNEASDEVQEKFGELIKSNPDEQTMITFVTTHFPHFNKVLIDEVNILKSIGEEETTTEE